MKENVVGKDECGTFAKYLKETFECEYEFIEDKVEEMPIARPRPDDTDDYEGWVPNHDNDTNTNGSQLQRGPLEHNPTAGLQSPASPTLPPQGRFCRRKMQDGLSQIFKFASPTIISETIQPYTAGHVGKPRNQEIEPKPDVGPDKLQNMRREDHFHKVDDNPCFFELVVDESVSNIEFQMGSPDQGDGESSGSWTSEADRYRYDEDITNDGPAVQWEVLKCSLIQGYIHADIRATAQKWADIAAKSNKTREEKDKEQDESEVIGQIQSLLEPQHRGRCLFMEDDMHDCGVEMNQNEEESIEYEDVYADPRPIDTSIAFLDVEDIEVNVNEIDENKEFLDEVIEVALDSGAGDHVAAPKEAPAYTMEESPGSLAGQHFTGAGGHRMKNQGQIRMRLRADNGKKGRDIMTTFQMAQVTRPLMSVSKVCDSGLWVKIDKDMATIMDTNNKEVCRFLRRGGLYVAKMRMRNPHYKPSQSFPRPGKK